MLPTISECVKGNNIGSIIICMGNIGPEARAANPMLKEILFSDDLHYMSMAAEALGKIGVKDDYVVARLYGSSGFCVGKKRPVFRKKP